MTLYESYRKRKLFWGGGNVQEDPAKAGTGLSTAISGVSALGAGIIDASAQPSQATGLQPKGATIAKAALSGASVGATLGPIGAGVGLVAGAGLGLLQANKMQRDARTAEVDRVAHQTIQERELSASRIAADPSLIYGNRASGYYANGGPMDPKPKVYRTQGEVEKANQFARNFAARHGTIAFNPEDVHVASKPGDLVVRFQNQDGTPYSGTGQSRKTFNVPAELGPDDIKGNSSEGYFYNDPHTGDSVPVDASVWNQPRFRNAKTATSVAKMADGGQLSAPLAHAFMNGGKAKSLSSDNAMMQGPPHEQGGIQLPELGAEVEGGETTKGDFVFSKRLGFAQAHLPIAKAKGIIEKKPMTFERVNALKRLGEREEALATQQESLKAKLGLQ